MKLNIELNHDLVFLLAAVEMEGMVDLCVAEIEDRDEGM